MKTIRQNILILIGCVVSGMAVIVYAMLDYQNRIYEYRYLPSSCNLGSSCPFPAINDGLIWLGITIAAVGIITILFRKITHRKGNK